MKKNALLIVAPALAVVLAGSAEAGTVTLVDSENFTTNTDPNAIVRPGTWSFGGSSGNQSFPSALVNFDRGSADKIVVAFSSENANNGGPVFYNGVEMTRVYFGNGARDTGLYYLDNPTGAGSEILFNYTAGNGVGGTIYALSNTLPGVGVFNLSSGGSTTLNGLTAGSIVIASAGKNQGSPPVAQSPLTPSFSSGAGSAAVGTGYAFPGSASLTASFNNGAEFTGAAEFLPEDDPPVIPTPSALLLGAAGIGALGLRRRRQSAD